MEPDQTLNTRIDSLSLHPWALGSHGRSSSRVGEGTHTEEFLSESTLEAGHTADYWRKCVSVSVCCLWGECVCVCMSARVSVILRSGKSGFKNRPGLLLGR